MPQRFCIRCYGEFIGVSLWRTSQGGSEVCGLYSLIKNDNSYGHSTRTQCARSFLQARISHEVTFSSWLCQMEGYMKADSKYS